VPPAGPEVLHAVEQAAPDVALARLRAGARHEAAAPRAVPDAEEARAGQREVQAGQGAEPARRGERHVAALPLAGVSAFRQDPVLPWLARRR
jgi:hypothetical protein